MNDTGVGQDFVSFVIDDLLLGVEIERIREISRNVTPTPVPHSLDYVSGVVNLRGELVTVVDLEVVLRGSRSSASTAGDCVIVGDGPERLALRVSAIGDVVRCGDQGVEDPPSNMRGREHHCYSGVVQLGEDLLVILDLDRVFAMMRGLDGRRENGLVHG